MHGAMIKIKYNIFADQQSLQEERGSENNGNKTR